MKIEDLKLQLENLGCRNSGCLVGPPQGAAPVGACRCLNGLEIDKRARLGRALRLYQEAISAVELVLSMRAPSGRTS